MNAPTLELVCLLKRGLNSANYGLDCVDVSVRERLKTELLWVTLLSVSPYAISNSGILVLNSSEPFAISSDSFCNFD